MDVFIFLAKKISFKKYFEGSLIWTLLQSRFGQFGYNVLVSNSEEIGQYYKVPFEL